MSPVHQRTRASCTARRFAEKVCGGIGVILLAVASSGCVRGDAAETSPGSNEALRFTDSAPSLDVLGRQVLAALTRRDLPALERLRLTEHEHNEVVWPELPASDPAVNFPLDYAWTNIENRNRKGLDRLLPYFAERQLGYLGVECRGTPQTFETFDVQTDCWLLFVVGDSPERWEVQAFKDVLRRGGGYKIFRYYDEEPRPYRGGTVG